MDVETPNATSAATRAGTSRGRRERWRGRVRIAGIALLTLGLLGAGGTLGWLLRGWLPGGGVGVTRSYVVERPVTVESSGSFHGSLPNVLGLPANEARAAYADAGVDPARLTLQEVPYVAQPGTVVEQRPPAAARITQGLRDVALLIARPAVMPDLVGVSGDEARQRLAAIGVGATTVVRYEPNAAAGAVAASSPPAGSRVGPHATLVVSEAPSSVDLANLGSATGDCSIADAQVAGKTVSQAFVCDVSGTAAHASYALNDRVSGFEASTALADGAPPGAQARLVVREDGAAVGSFDVGTTPRSVRVALHPGKRLTLAVGPLSGGADSFEVVLAGARIVGSRSGIDALVAAANP